MKIALAAFLIGGLCTSTLGLVTEHFFVSENLKWDDARSNCQSQYTELSSIRDNQEMEILQALSNKGWIGLQRAIKDANIWKWTDGANFSYQNWGDQEPNSGGNCVAVINGKWCNFFCYQLYPSFCSLKTRSMVVVQRNVTWEEALVYCRTNYKDLVSLLSQKELAVALQKINAAQGTYWWTGLRYLGDSWMWVNGDPLSSDLWGTAHVQQCPVNPLHCGALGANGYLQRNRNCEDQLGFICLAE